MCSPEYVSANGHEIPILPIRISDSQCVVKQYGFKGSYKTVSDASRMQMCVSYRFNSQASHLRLCIGLSQKWFGRFNVSQMI